MRPATITGSGREALRVAIGEVFRRDSIDPTYVQIDELVDILGQQGYEITARSYSELPL